MAYIEIRVILREGISGLEAAEYAETIKDEIHDSDPESGYISDVTYEIKDETNDILPDNSEIGRVLSKQDVESVKYKEMDVKIAQEEKGTWSAWIEDMPIYASAPSLDEVMRILKQALADYEKGMN